MFENKVMERGFPENLYYAITEQEAAPKDCGATLMYLLYRLPEGRAEMILERYRDGLSFRSIGARHGFSGAYVEKTISRCIDKLRCQSLFLCSGVEGALKLSEEKPAAEKPVQKYEGFDSIYIADMGFSERSFNALTKEGLVTVADIIWFGDDLEHVANLGVKSLREICEKLANIGVDVKKVFYRISMKLRLD